METSLHRELKALYAGRAAQTEVRLDGFRIDAVCRGRLVEVQHGSLSAIRGKIARLCEQHDVLVVKPLVAEKWLVQCADREAAPHARRRSPKRQSWLDLFRELVYFRSVFPHPRLVLEAVLVEVEEWRAPGHGRRRRWRRNDFEVLDQKLLAVRARRRLATAADLLRLLPTGGLPRPFHSGHLAEALGEPRWIAQQVVYCLRHMGAVREAGKQGNTRLYELPRRGRRAG